MLVRSGWVGYVRYGFGDHRVPYAGKATDLSRSIRNASGAENDERPFSTHSGRTLGVEWNFKAL